MSSHHIPQDAFEILDTIDRRGSFAKAAEELGKATSAISYGVQKLEEQLDITIFERHGRRSVLTPAGKLLLEEGRVILAATARLADRAKELANGWEPRLRIGAEATVNQDILFSILNEFQRNHPNMEIDIRETLLNGSWEALAQQQVDVLVGAVGPVPAHKGFRSICIGETDLVPVIASTLPDAEHIAASGDLPSVQHVVSHDTAATEVARNEGLSAEGHRVFYVQTMEQKTLAIKAGLGIGHLPRHLIQGAIDQGHLLPLSIQTNHPKQYVAWHLSNRGKGLQQLVQSVQTADWTTNALENR